MVELSLALKLIKGSREKIFFPVLGIMLGVASIVGILALSRGGKMVIERDLSHMGENRIVVVSENADLRDLDYLEKLPFVDYAGAQELGFRDMETGMVIYSTSRATRRAKGIRENLNPGEILLEVDSAKEHTGSRVQINLRGKQTWLNVVGTYEEANPLRKRNGERYAIADNSTMKAYIEGAVRRGIVVSLKKGEDAQELAPLIVSSLNRFNPRGDYNVVDSATAHNFVNRIKKSLTGFLMGVAIIAVVLGGFGMSSFMANLINERTSHIGMLKAMGAKNSFIFKMFLSETLILSTIGGAAGVVLGAILSFTLGNAVGIPATPNMSEIGLGFMLAIVMGGCFGIIPAKRAAELNPVEAIRK